jgi:hypothetical protein
MANMFEPTTACHVANAVAAALSCHQSNFEQVGALMTFAMRAAGAL